MLKAIFCRMGPLGLLLRWLIYYKEQWSILYVQQNWGSFSSQWAQLKYIVRILWLNQFLIIQPEFQVHFVPTVRTYNTIYCTTFTLGETKTGTYQYLTQQIDLISMGGFNGWSAKMLRKNKLWKLCAKEWFSTYCQGHQRTYTYSTIFYTIFLGINLIPRL